LNNSITPRSVSPADAPFVANGTINQVLADRAAAAQAQGVAQAASVRQAASAANVAATDAQTSALNPPTSDLSAAGTRAVDARVPPTLGQNFKNIETDVKSEDKQQERRRRLAATTTSHHTSHRSGNPGASIRTIDVDGQRFNLQNGTPKPDEPAQPAH
jgi:hypothetical protein